MSSGSIAGGNTTFVPSMASSPRMSLKQRLRKKLKRYTLTPATTSVSPQCYERAPEQYAFSFTGPRTGQQRIVPTHSDLPKSIQQSGAYQEVHKNDREREAKESLPYKAVKRQGQRVASQEDVEKIHERLQNIDFDKLRHYGHNLDLKGRSREQIADKIRALLLLKATEKAAKKRPADDDLEVGPLEDDELVGPLEEDEDHLIGELEGDELVGPLEDDAPPSKLDRLKAGLAKIQQRKDVMEDPSLLKGKLEEIAGRVKAAKEANAKNDLDVGPLEGDELVGELSPDDEHLVGDLEAAPAAPQKPSDKPKAPTTTKQKLLTLRDKAIAARKTKESGVQPTAPVAAQPPAVAQKAAEGVKGKEPWEMTKGDTVAAAGKSREEQYRDWPVRVFNKETGSFVQEVPSRLSGKINTTKYRVERMGSPEDPVADNGWKGNVEQRHRQDIQAAIAAGKPVPPSVLADYPDLAAKAKAAPQTPAAAPTPPPPSKPLTLAQKAKALRKEKQAAKPNLLPEPRDAVTRSKGYKGPPVFPTPIPKSELPPLPPDPGPQIVNLKDPMGKRPAVPVTFWGAPKSKLDKLRTAVAKARSKNIAHGSPVQFVPPPRAPSPPVPFSSHPSAAGTWPYAIHRDFPGRIVGEDDNSLHVRTKYGGPLAKWIKEKRAGYWDGTKRAWIVDKKHSPPLLRYLRANPQAYERQESSVPKTVRDKLRAMVACRL